MNPKAAYASKLVARAVGRGVLTKQPCPCGERRVDGHHEDYDKPLEVVWLCRSCHNKRHWEINGDDDPRRTRRRPALKKRTTITISLSLEMIQQVTTTARRLDQSRSQLIEQTLRDGLGGNKKRAA